MSFNTPHLSRYSRRAFGIYGYVAALALVCVSAMAWAQLPQASPVKTNTHAINTPKQVELGTAKLLQPYEPTSKLRLAISIKAPKMAEEEKLLKELQDRNSPNFHKYLTPEQWNARFAPAGADEQAVADWVNSHGLTVTARYPNRLMVDAEGTVDAIQKAFDIKINRYEVNGQVEFSNDRDPVIPGNLVGIIQYVDGLNSILRMRPANTHMKGMRGPDYSPGPVRQEGIGGGRDADKAAVAALKSLKSGRQAGSQVTNGWYDPSDIFGSNMYDYNALMDQGHCCNPFHTSGYGGGSPIQTSIGLATDGAFLNSDMYGFVGQYPYLASHWFVHWVDGTPGCCDDETTLDTEWSTATSNSRGSEFDTSSIHVYETANGFGSFGDIFQQMLTDNLVNVVNISYGLNEDYLNGFGLVSAWHAQFNQMLGQGWTIMAASGDNGAAAGCGDAIAVLYPESDPDVVSVGGTQLALNSDGSFNSEVTWTGDTYSGACSSNHGGTGGGCSNLFSAPGYQSSPACGSSSRSVPDIALNASSHTAQNFYFEGSLQGVAGTSIASPMMSGFVAQANAYLLSIGLGGTPIGELDYILYYEGYNEGGQYASPHYPYYDTLSGCNSNDDTFFYGLGSYCAGTGYDLTTGWGSFNALQLSWAINSYDLGAFIAPTITFSGPSHTQGADNWYNTDQTVSWTVTSNAEGGLTPTGVAGFSSGWDQYFFDAFSEATPGSGNPFYSGPEYPNATTGSLDLASAGQGCHFATVNAWDNAGYTPGDQYYYYLCYDTVPPVTSASLSGSLNGSIYDSAVKVTLSATDPAPGSGVSHTYYSVDGGGYAAYSAAFTISALGSHTVRFYSVDAAGNFESLKSVSFFIASLTSTSLTSSLNPSRYLQPITLTAKVTALYAGTANGTVTFKFGSTTLGTGTLSGGVATLNTNALPEGTSDALTAVYGGASDFFGSTSPVYTQSVLKGQTTTTLTSSVNPTEYGESTTLTATIVAEHGGTPTGTITFLNGTTTIGTAALSGGKATLAVSTLPVGTDSITAAYGGSGNYLTSTSNAVSQVVYKSSTKTALASSANPAGFGESVKFTATVTPAFGAPAIGTVTFKNGTTVIGTGTLSGGKATLAVSNLALGTSSITAAFGGSTDYQSSTSSALSQVVKAASTTTTLASSKNPSAYGQSVTFTATVTPVFGGTATGTVTFKNGTATLGTGTLSGGKAALTVTTLPVATSSITAVYGGSTDYVTSTSSALSQVVYKASTTSKVTSSLNPAKAGTKVTFTATVTAASGPTPTGSVTFLDGATTLGTETLNSSGVATFTTTTLSKATHSITIHYGGSTLDSSDTSPALSQVID